MTIGIILLVLVIFLIYRFERFGVLEVSEILPLSPCPSPLVLFFLTELGMNPPSRCHDQSPNPKASTSANAENPSTGGLGKKP